MNESADDAARLRRTSTNGDLIAIAAIAIAAFLRHATQLGAWWTYDDPQILIQAIRESYAGIFASPEHWRMYSASNLVPFLPASFKLDLQVAGLTPWWFYAHQLIAMAAAASLLYVYARTFASRAASAVAALSFLVVPLTVEASHMLMLRHYVEGLALALGSLIAWSRYGRNGRWPALATAAVLYFLAMACKEIYAPLPLLMIADSVQRRARTGAIARSLVPVALAAMAYLPWRFWMLQSAGGYGAFSWPNALLRLPTTAWFGVAGSAPAWLEALWAILVVAVLFALQGAEWMRVVLIAIAVSIYLALPLIPVVLKFERRHAFAVSVAAVFFAAVIADRIAGRRLRIAALCALVVIPGMAGVYEQRLDETRDRVMRAEGMFLWTEPASPRVLYGTSGGWYLDGLRWLRKELRHEIAPPYYSSTIGLVLDRVPPERIVSAVGWPNAKILAAVAARQRIGAMNVAAGRRGNIFGWKVSPSRDWVLLTPMGAEMFTLPGPAGALPFPAEFFAPSCESSQRTMRFARVRSDGTWIVSPLLPFPARDGVVRWASR